MNQGFFQRYWTLLELAARAGILRLIVELEPANSTEIEHLRKAYAHAHGEWQAARLRAREAKLNKSIRERK